jgi:myo-inositol-1(or 4)-monophosphatase
MEYIQAMRQAAKHAGEFMLHNKTLTNATQKSVANDFVTVADIKSQDLIRKELTAAFPKVLIVSEEDSEEMRAKLSDLHFTGFVLDPIDGTYNFKRGMQESAISIGYIKHGEPHIGVIYDPYKDELYEAELGKGALCNGQPIQVSEHSGIEGASVATSNGYNYEAAVRNFERQIAIYNKTGIMPWSSCPGSAVLVLAWIAAGRIDAIHHTGFKPWDNAAGFLLVREAGGFVHTLQGKEARFTDSCILAASPAVGHALEEIFDQLDPALMQ